MIEKFLYAAIFLVIC